MWLLVTSLQKGRTLMEVLEIYTLVKKSKEVYRK